MMKKTNIFKVSKALTVSLFMVFMATSVAQAMVCAPPGTSERSQTVINQIQERTQDILEKVEDAAFKLQEVATMLSANASTNAELSAVAKQMEHKTDLAEAEMVAQVETKKLSDAEQTAKDTKIVASDCVLATGTASQPEGDILKAAAEGAMNNDDTDALTNTPIDDGNDLEPTSELRRHRAGRVNTARGSNYAVAKTFRDYIIFYCDPNENAGNMPTADNPLIYVNSSGDEVNYWCGMGRDENSAYLKGAPQNMRLILGYGFFSTWKNYSGLYGAFEQLKRDLTGIEPDVMNSSDFNTPEGQQRLKRLRAQINKLSLARAVINNAAARRQPTHTVGDGEFNWLSGVCKKSIGVDASDAYKEMCDNLPSRVAETAWMEGMVKQFTNPDYILTTLSQIESPVRMLAEANKILAQNMRIAHLRMLQAEKRNVLMAAIWAEGIK